MTDAGDQGRRQAGAATGFAGSSDAVRVGDLLVLRADVVTVGRSSPWSYGGWRMIAEAVNETGFDIEYLVFRERSTLCWNTLRSA